MKIITNPETFRRKMRDEMKAKLQPSQPVKKMRKEVRKINKPR